MGSAEDEVGPIDEVGTGDEPVDGRLQIRLQLAGGVVQFDSHDLQSRKNTR